MIAAALTAVLNAARRIDLGDLAVQVDRAISACREAGTKLPWPGEGEAGAAGDGDEGSDDE